MRRLRIRIRIAAENERTAAHAMSFLWKRSAEKKISAVAFRLKGAGWYETDFKSGDKRNVAGQTTVVNRKCGHDNGKR